MNATGYGCDVTNANERAAREKCHGRIGSNCKEVPQMCPSELRVSAAMSRYGPYQGSGGKEVRDSF